MIPQIVVVKHLGQRFVKVTGTFKKETDLILGVLGPILIITCK